MSRAAKAGLGTTSNLIKRVNNYWFKGVVPKQTIPQDRPVVWLGKDPTHVEEIRTLFSKDMFAYSMEIDGTDFQGSYSDLEAEPEGPTALIILMSLMRKKLINTPEAFAYDNYLRLILSSLISHLPLAKLSICLYIYLSLFFYRLFLSLSFIMFPFCIIIGTL